MTRLTDIIKINISRDTATVAQTEFNVPLFISAHTSFKERTREYSSLQAVAADFASTDTAYIAAIQMFSQPLTPAKIILGRRQIPGVTVNVTTVTPGKTYTMTINDVAFNFTAVQASTAASIASGLKDNYLVTPLAGITVVDHQDGTLSVSSSADWSLKVGSGLAKASQPSTEAWADTVSAVQNSSDKWYVATIESHATADVLAVAAVIEAKRKLFATSSQAVDITTGVTTDLFSQLEALGYFRTFGIWSATADTQFPECAWVGYQLQEQPGSNTWAYKTLSGVSVSTLNDSASSNIQSKSASTYENVGTLNSTVGGKTFGGEWIDVMIFVDWLEARMNERLWRRLHTMKKIPYTAAGLTIVETDIRSQLNDGIRVGGLDGDFTPTVTMPVVRNISSNVKGQRILEGIKFEATLAGAIHFITIQGTVTV